MQNYLIIGGIIVFVIILVIILNNRLVSLKNAIEGAFADMDVQMKMRFDLVENLVATVKGYTDHEKNTLQALTDARTQWMKATTPQDKAAATNQLEGALKTLFATAEAYPDLKANTNFLQLQTQLKEIETEIASSRRYYNATIMDYNNALMSFPSNIVAKIGGFTNIHSYFEITEEQRQAPKVKF